MMQPYEYNDLKRALIRQGYSGVLAEKIISYYLHSDLKCLM